VEEGRDPARPPGRLRRPPSRLRQVAMIVVFDLGGPLLVYALLRHAGMSAVSALVISGVLPAIGITVGAVVDGRLDIIGVVVLAGIAVGTVLGLVSHNARLFLLEGSVPSLVFALACLASLKASKPLIYRFAVEILGPDTPKGRDAVGAWRYPGFRRAFQIITVAWGAGYLVEDAVRITIIETASTGIALLCSKLLPYAFALVLATWTFGYGEHEKRKAERAAAAAPESQEVPSAPLYTHPVRRTLIVTNDFPPRQGGIQSFVHALATRLPPGTVTVYAPAWAGAAEFDAGQPFPVIRHPTSLMLPGPAVRRRAAAIAREHGCDAALFGAAAPLGLITPALRRAGVTRVVALTHGHEAGWAALPGARALLRRIGDEVDVLTYLGEYFRVRLAGVLSPEAAGRMVRLAPGVDLTTFRPGAGGAAVRDRLGLAGRPVAICVSRMVPRKGQDTLIRAWPQVRAAVSDPVLLLVGDGPHAPALRRLAQRVGVRDSVLFTGPVPRPELPGYYDAADVFAMPCRTRRSGLDVEGLGLVYLEASATGLPVIAGDSGGAPDAILDGETGYVVRDVPAAAARLTELLNDPGKARAMGEKGLAWVDREWRWELAAARLAAILG
jgi:phosphatidyl-myo-inositol dimannoside synthase